MITMVLDARTDVGDVAHVEDITEQEQVVLGSKEIIGEQQD